MFFQSLIQKYFLGQIKKIKWRNEEILTEILRENLRNEYIKPVKTLDPIRQYTIKNSVVVYINKNRDKLEYVIVEPQITPEIEETVLRLYIENPSCKSNYCIEKTLRMINDEDIYKTYINHPLGVSYHYHKLQSGYGPLYPLIIDPHIEEISGNCVDRYIQIIHRDYTWYGWMNTNIELSESDIDRLVLGLARRSGKHISLAYPIVEGLTPEGARISLTYGWEVSRKGSSFTIRKKPPRIITITELIDQGVIDPFITAYLWLILELKGFIIIGGGMSSGKTTLLQALLTLIPSTRRIVTIEDTPEIMGSTGIWDPLTERKTIYSDETSIDMYKLLKFSLRRRADYIVVGEVRGREARLLVQASRLGHGILTTIHGEDADSILERLIAPPISIPRNLLANIWSIVVMENIRGRRSVRRVYEIDRRLNTRIIYDHSVKNSNLMDEIIGRTRRLRELIDDETLRLEITRRALFLQELVNRGVFSIDLLGDEITKYYYQELFAEQEVRGGE